LKATFRPNIPPPTSSVLPPLQPTTTGIGTLLNGLPQPTSYFTQPILRNGKFEKFFLSFPVCDCKQYFVFGV